MPPQELPPSWNGDCQNVITTTEIKYGVDNKAYKPDSNEDLDTNENIVEIKEHKTTDFDDLLPHVGEFGLYQKMLFLLMIPFSFFVAFVYFSQIFMTLVPEQYWCWVPELGNLSVDERITLAIPHKTEGAYNHDRCHMYKTNWSQVLFEGRRLANQSWEVIKCNRGWEYKRNDVPYETIATQLDWVCDEDDRAATAQAFFFGGAIVGGLVFGWIADKYGRIPALVGTNLVGFSAGVGTAFCNSFYSFAICRFLVGMAFDNCFTMMYILVLEYVGPKWRTFVANMSIGIFFTIASSSLPWIALWANDWRKFAIWTSVPFALAIVTPWLVPESARWLVSQGRLNEALLIMERFEKFNSSKIPDKILNDFKESSAKRLKECEMESKSFSVLDIFKTPRLRRNAVLLIVIWMAISLVFDGHVRNVGSLGLDVFLTFTVASATELPADTFLTAVLDRWGRRWLACGSMVISGIFSLLATTVPTGKFSASLAIMGRFAVNISYNVGLQYAAELLPTVVRAQGVALIHIMGYVASILAPYVVYLANISQVLPLLILGSLGIVGGILCLFLPETMDTEMPQTLQDGENFGKDQHFWNIPCCGSNEEKVADCEERYRRQSLSKQGSEIFFVRDISGTVKSRNSVRASIRSNNSRNRLNDKIEKREKV